MSDTALFDASSLGLLQHLLQALATKERKTPTRPSFNWGLLQHLLQALVTKERKTPTRPSF